MSDGRYYSQFASRTIICFLLYSKRIAQIEQFDSQYARWENLLIICISYNCLFFSCTRSKSFARARHSFDVSMRDTRIELVSQRWQRYVLPLNQSRMSFDRLGV